MLSKDYSEYNYTQLAQSRPSGTSAVSLVNPSANQDVMVTSVVIANTTGSAAAYSIFHDIDGTTYDQTTALAYAVSLPANSFVEVRIEFPLATTAGNLAIQTDTSNALTFTAYGYQRIQ